MSKKLSSTILLFLIAIGFAAYSIYLFTQAHDTDGVILACLYAIPALAAVGALVLLPFKKEEQ